MIRGESHADDDDDDDEYSYDDDDDDYDSCNDDGAIEESDLLSRCGLKVTDSSHLAICLTSNSSISNFSSAQSIVSRLPQLRVIGAPRVPPIFRFLCVPSPVAALR